MKAILPQPGYLSLKLIMPRRRLFASFFLVCRSSGLALGLVLGLALGVVIPGRSLALVAQEKTSGLPLPRFVSLRSSEVNLRTGPGVQYPVDWVYNRQKLPVEVIAEYDTWRKIRDWQGTQGWVHQSMLTGQRTVIIIGDTRTLRLKPEAESAAIAQAEASVIGKLLQCPNQLEWCKVDVDGFEGWIRRVEIWGLHRNELVE